MKPAWLVAAALAVAGGGLAIAVIARGELLGPCPGFADERLRPGSAAELRRALDAAGPGDIVELTAGVYEGRFELRREGVARQPITLCGHPGAVLDAGSIETGYGLHVTADHWHVTGLEIRNALKGIVLDEADHVVLASLFVHDIGTEGIRLRDGSSDTLVERVRVENTGLGRAENGEAIYIGTASSQWCDRGGCEPDRSDRNIVQDSVLGPGVAAEAVDIKEGTTGGVVRGNRFNGTGLTGADSWIDLKGNEYTIVDNEGTGSPNDGIQIHAPQAGWGSGNVLGSNLLVVQGPGHGVWVDDKASGNTVSCSNVVRDAEAGYANVPCVE